MDIGKLALIDRWQLWWSWIFPTTAWILQLYTFVFFAVIAWFSFNAMVRGDGPWIVKFRKQLENAEGFLIKAGLIVTIVILGAATLDILPPWINPLPERITQLPYTTAVIVSVKAHSFKSCHYVRKGRGFGTPKRLSKRIHCVQCRYFPEIRYRFIHPKNNQIILESTMPSEKPLFTVDDRIWRQPCFQIKADYEAFVSHYPINSQTRVYINPPPYRPEYFLDILTR